MLINICDKLIFAIVKVPVLSVHIQDVDPNVSTVYKFLTSTFLEAILTAAAVKQIVTVTINPSGTFAIIIPIAYTNETIGLI